MTEIKKVDLDSIKAGMRSKGRLIPIVTAQAAVENNDNNERRDKKYLHPSEICKRDWCARASMYQINEQPPDKKKEMGFQTLNVFATGHMIHAKWQGWLERAGILKQSEMPIFDEEHHIMGTADGLISDAQGEAILEIKSVGIGTVRYEAPDLLKGKGTETAYDHEVWWKLRQPLPSHLRQINLYMYVTGVHKGIVLYEWKGTQECKEFEVTYQPALIQHILATAAVVKSHLENGTLIDRPAWAEKDHRACKVCPYKNTCWSTDAD